MNVVAVFETRRRAWVWRIVNAAGNQLSSGETDYASMEEALRAGAEHRDRLAGRRTPSNRQPVRGRRRTVRP